MHIRILICILLITEALQNDEAARRAADVRDAERALAEATARLNEARAVAEVHDIAWENEGKL